MLSDSLVKWYIDQTKSFWMITDFEKEILNWSFKIDPPKNLIFNIGHPRNSHKGTSVGDILPYTRLPEVIKEKYPNAKVTIPEWFTPVFKNNPHIDDFNGITTKWGSLGTFGTTIQRTCNVWGFKTFKFSPKVYSAVKKRNNNCLLFCVNSKTGGRIKDINLFEDIIENLKSKYYCVQLALTTDSIIRTANEYVFNVDINNLVDFVSQFNIYIGSQNSIYHLSKALDLQIIGILPENIPPDLVKLPLLTQINHLEIEMLSDEEKKRSMNWKKWMESQGKNPNDSHHIGWLYPDVTHLTERKEGLERCLPLSIKNINKALNNELYPFGDDRLWDINKHRNLWIGGGFNEDLW